MHSVDDQRRENGFLERAYQRTVGIPWTKGRIRLNVGSRKNGRKWMITSRDAQFSYFCNEVKINDLEGWQGVYIRENVSHVGVVTVM